VYNKEFIYLSIYLAKLPLIVRILAKSILEELLAQTRGIWFGLLVNSLSSTYLHTAKLG
jgi:hypothetical protein